VVTSPGSYDGPVPVIEQLKADISAAMKAGDRDLVTTLRLVLSELQKAEKEGETDEVAVLRRERKRRHEAATSYREAGRDELAGAEEAEAEVIEGYLPAELSDEELKEIVAGAVSETGAEGPADMGAVMKAAMARVDGRADGGRVSAVAREVLAG
jgi:uncharacterized protein YqeY